MAFDLSFWIQWERQPLAPGVQLERCLGGTGRAAAFAAQFQGRPATVKIFPGEPEAILAQLAVWKRTSALAHPALRKILHTGEASLGHTRCAYAVMERADENLGDVLADRLLTPDEARDMLTPLLSALRFLHSKGYAHGSVKPSNILAVGEQLQISSDNLVQGGDTAADIRAVGTLLQHVLSGFDRRPPEPFAGIVNGCLEADPAARWSLARVEAHLRGEPPPAEHTGASRMKWWGVGAAAVAFVSVMAWRQPAATDLPPSAAPPSAAPAPVVTPEAPPTPPPTKPVPEAKPATRKKETTTPPPPKPKAAAEPVKPKPEPPPPAVTAAPPVATGSIRQVMPEIPQQARNTIVGRVRINIRVRVDAEGNVTQASVDSPRVSRYFTDRVLAASRAWKFPAGSGGPSSWVLRYDLGRDQTRVSPERLGN